MVAPDSNPEKYRAGRRDKPLILAAKIR